MKLRSSAVCAMTALAIIAQSMPAAARGHDHWGGGRDGAWPILGVAAVGTALVVGAAELLTAPIRAANEAAAAPQPGYGYNQAPPNYYAPAPAYYPPPAYAPAPVAYYGAPPVYYAPAPYYGRGYYR